MPIRPELRPLYRTAEWRELRRQVLERAGNRCEACSKPNGAVFTYTWQTWTVQERRLVKLYHMAWVAAGAGRWRDQYGRKLERWFWPAAGLPRRIWSVISVAHLDERGPFLDPNNVRALCAWCHLHRDQSQHKTSRCQRKDTQRPLLQETSA